MGRSSQRWGWEGGRSSSEPGRSAKRSGLKTRDPAATGGLNRQGPRPGRARSSATGPTPTAGRIQGLLLRSTLALEETAASSFPAPPPPGSSPQSRCSSRPRPLGGRGSLPGHPPDPHTRPAAVPQRPRAAEATAARPPPTNPSPAAGDGPAFLSGPAPGPART